MGSPTLEVLPRGTVLFHIQLCSPKFSQTAFIQDSRGCGCKLVATSKVVRFTKAIGVRPRKHAKRASRIWRDSFVEAK